MTDKNISKAKCVWGLFVIIAIVVTGMPILFHTMNIKEMAIVGFHGEENMRLAFASDQKEAIHQLIKEGKYRCCIENPCSYCFLNSTASEDGTVCDCLDEIVNGEHPCGECMGEILEGNGNKYLSEYFPAAIADEVGNQYLDVLGKIVDDKYNKVK